jgi:hypothetical protein
VVYSCKDHVASGELRSAWEASDGLCSPHFRLAWQRGGGVRSLLTAVQKDHLRRLLFHLHACVEARGDVADGVRVFKAGGAWRCAVQQMHGLWP